MKLVFDTNVVLDVLARRRPFFDASLRVLDSIGKKAVSGAITANSLTDIFFLYRKHQSDPRKRKEAIREIISSLEVLDTTRAICFAALDSAIDDFEDAIVAESAKAWSADLIVTRDAGGFAASPVMAIEPDELAARFD